MIHSIDIRREEPTDFKKLVNLTSKVFKNRLYTDENKPKPVNRRSKEQQAK